MDADKVAAEILREVWNYESDNALGLLAGIAAIIRRHQGEPNEPSPKESQCRHLNMCGHEWEMWCSTCGQRWPNSLTQAAYTPVSGMPTSGKFPISRPCSACSGGDEEMKHHDHEGPGRETK